MAQIVKIRACVFIPVPWLLLDDGATTGRRLEYQGDNREFTPHAGNTLRFRVEQEAVVDFQKRELFSHAATGISRERVTWPNGVVEQRVGHASADRITCSAAAWMNGGVSFAMRASAGNPLIVNADDVDYEVHLVVQEATGHVTARGRHDGFPCFEFYKQVDMGDFQLVYRYDHRITGKTPAALAGPMDQEFDASW